MFSFLECSEERAPATDGPFARDCLLNSLSRLEPRYYYLPTRQDGAFFLPARLSRIIFALLTFPSPHARFFPLHYSRLAVSKAGFPVNFPKSPLACRLRTLRVFHHNLVTVCSYSEHLHFFFSLDFLPLHTNCRINADKSPILYSASLIAKRVAILIESR